MTFAEQDADLARPAFPELVGVKEIAGVLAVSPQRPYQLTMRNDFPDPIARLAAGPVWTRPSLERFVDEWRTDKPDNSELVAQLDRILAKVTAAQPAGPRTPNRPGSVRGCPHDAARDPRPCRDRAPLPTTTAHFDTTLGALTKTANRR